MMKLHELPQELYSIIIDELLRLRLRKSVGKIISDRFRDGELRFEAYIHMGESYMRKHLFKYK